MPDTEGVRGLLKPLPFRGDLIAAGAVALSVGVLLADARMQDTWAAGVRFVVVGAFAALLLALAARAPVEGDVPRTYVSVLLAAAFPLTAAALLELGTALGGESGSASTITWVLAALALLYGALAAIRNSAVCALLGAASAVGALVAAWTWAFDPNALTPYRWLLLAAVVVLALGAIRLRDGRRAHAVALVDVAGLSGVALGALATGWAIFLGEGGGGTPWGWQLALLALGLGLIAYAAVDRERGPAWLGAIVLALFMAAAGDSASLLWWPLLLIALGGAVIAAGLRPTTPAPPPPDVDAPPAPTRSLR
jgi:hypothetical protein